MTAPLVHPDLDMRGYPNMPVDVHWMRRSRFCMLATGIQFRAGFTLMCKAWHRVPCSSIPDDDRQLADLAEINIRRWRRMRGFVLGDWVLCDDGRHYHETLARWALASGIKRSLRGPAQPRFRKLDIGHSAWATLRAQVFERDSYTCRYCRNEAGPFECDHVIPVSRGGLSEESNLVTACRRCNRRKGARPLDVFERFICQ